MDGAFVEVAAEQSEEVGGEEQRLHQGAVGQLACHLEDGVRPGTFREDLRNPDSRDSGDSVGRCPRVSQVLCIAFDRLCSGVLPLRGARQDHLQLVQEEVKAAGSVTGERLLVVGLLTGSYLGLGLLFQCCPFHMLMYINPIGWVLLKCVYV